MCKFQSGHESCRWRRARSIALISCLSGWIHLSLAEHVSLQGQRGKLPYWSLNWRMTSDLPRKMLPHMFPTMAALRRVKAGAAAACGARSLTPLTSWCKVGWGWGNWKNLIWLRIRVRSQGVCWMLPWARDRGVCSLPLGERFSKQATAPSAALISRCAVNLEPATVPDWTPRADVNRGCIFLFNTVSTIDN